MSPHNHARIVSSGPMVTLAHVDGAWQTSPGWIGPLRHWKARRYAKRHGLHLVTEGP